MEYNGLQRRILEMLQTCVWDTFTLKVMARLMSDGDCPDFSYREYIDALEALKNSGAIVIHGQKIVDLTREII